VLGGVLFVVLATTVPASAEVAEGSARMIVIAAVDNVAAARREARRAASLLEYPIGDSWQADATQPTDVGRVIGLLQAADDRFIVTAYVGKPGETAAELDVVRKSYPKATIVATTVGKDTKAKAPSEVSVERAGIVIASSHASYRLAVKAAKAFSVASGIVSARRE
jgi:hypothetical protein